jgi:hypothetical protein
MVGGPTLLGVAIERRKEAGMARFEELAMTGLAICGFGALSFAWARTILSAF